MIKYYLSLILVLCCHASLTAQQNIIKAIAINENLGQGGGVDYGYEIAQQEDGYLILNYHVFWPLPIGKDWNGLVKVDFEGNLKWKKEYYYVPANSYGDTDASQKMAIIDDLVYLSYQKRGPDYFYPVLMAVDWTAESGDSLWTESFDLGVQFEEDKLLLAKDGLLYMVVGDKYLYSDRLKLLCIDKRGTLRWERELLADRPYLRPVALIPSSSGGFILGCAIYDFGASYDSWGAFIKLDSLGFRQQIIELERQHDVEDWMISKVLECRNGDLIGVSSIYNGHDIFNHQAPPVLNRISPDGELIWRHVFFDWDEQYIYQLEEANNGDIVGAGYSGISEGTEYPMTSVGAGGWIFRFSPEGELKWERRIVDTLLSPAKGMGFSGFIEKEDGSFVLTGGVYQSFPWGESDPNILFMTLDANGCFQSGCEDIQLITQLSLVPDEETTLHVFPNPFTDNLTLQTPASALREDFSVEIFSNGGQLLFFKKVTSPSKKITFTLPGLEKGLYLVGLRTRSGTSYSTKIVKE